MLPELSSNLVLMLQFFNRVYTITAASVKVDFVDIHGLRHFSKWKSSFSKLYNGKSGSLYLNRGYLNFLFAGHGGKVFVGGKSDDWKMGNCFAIKKGVIKS